jgi:hypothetical protein
MTSIGLLLEMMNSNGSRINKLERKFDDINKKLDIIIEILNKDLKKNCKKMGEHIDFVENVYDNVKNPLGFLCNKINYFSKDNENYTLHDRDYKLTEEEITDCLLCEETNEKII